MDRTNRMMMWTMPLLSLWIGFSLPSAMCIYWIVQYLVTMVQELICSKLLKKDYEKARIAAQERERRLEEEKANRGKKKQAQKKADEPEQEGVDKTDSREGIRAYARGRAYIPSRFGQVTAYQDPNESLLRQEAAAGKRKKRGAAVPTSEEDVAAVAAPTPATTPEAQREESVQSPTPDLLAPAQKPKAPVELEEIEVEVEEIEVEEDEKEEGV
jgi:YidC/Oxa1 family membrane protein insertase